jgi:hypothetical protein
MRKVIISDEVRQKIKELEYFLIDGLKLSEAAAYKRSDRMRTFVASLSMPVDYALCRFKKWREMGYRCAVFEQDWVFAYEIFDDGIIVRDMSHTACLQDNIEKQFYQP